MNLLLPTLLLLLLDSALAHGPALSPGELQKREQHHLEARRAFALCHHSLLRKRSENQRREEFVRRHLEKKRRARAKRHAAAVPVAAAAAKAEAEAEAEPKAEPKAGPEPEPEAAEERMVRRQNEPTRTQKPIATGSNTANPFNGIPTCVLAPQSIQGPYYLPGELIRNDIRENEPGVDLLLDVQVFDARSCKVMPSVMVDFWHANSTGVYSGYSVEGTDGLTWLRGLAETDNDGLVQVTTKWPGHYSGRAIHIHIMAHINGQIRTRTTNGREERTYVGGTRPYVGQLFFPMDAIDAVEATAPYSSNPNTLTRNDQDSIFKSVTDAVSGFDGLVDLRRLGANAEDGYLAWISVGIDTSRDHDTGFPNDASSSSGSSSSSSTSGTTAPGNTGIGSVVAAGKLVAVAMGVVAAVAFWA